MNDADKPLDALRDRSTPATAYDRAQSVRDAEVVAVRDRMLEVEGRLLAVLRRIEAVELEVARLKGPQPMVSVHATASSGAAGYVMGLPIQQPSTESGDDLLRRAREFHERAYPPLPDEGT